jgi:hypothetical protein
MTLDEIAKEIARYGIPVTINYNKQEDEFRYEIPGFYKSDTVYLVERNNKFYCIQRYNETEELYEDDFMDALVRINCYWWRVTKERNPDDTIEPNDYWKDLLIEYGYVKVETKTVTLYK